MDQQIIALANTLWNNRFCGKDNWLAIFREITFRFEAIESEIKQLEKKIEVTDKNVLESLRKQWKCLYSLESRIKALESYVLTGTYKVPPKDPLSYDGHGKPPGGLKPGIDIVSYKDCGKKVMGIFQYIKSGLSSDPEIWANWQKYVGESFQTYTSFMPKSQVTFEFRPKFPEKS